MDEVESCDRIALMSRGRIVALDTPDGLKRDPRVARAGFSSPTLEDVFVALIGEEARP